MIMKSCLHIVCQTYSLKKKTNKKQRQFPRKFGAFIHAINFNSENFITMAFQGRISTEAMKYINALKKHSYFPGRSANI